MLEAFLYRILPYRTLRCVVLDKPESIQADLQFVLTQLARNEGQKTLEAPKRKWATGPVSPGIKNSSGLTSKIQRTGSPAGRGRPVGSQDAQPQATAKPRINPYATVSAPAPFQEAIWDEAGRRERDHQKAVGRQKVGREPGPEPAQQEGLFANLSLGAESEEVSGQETRVSMSSHTEWLRQLLVAGKLETDASQKVQPPVPEIDAITEMAENSKFLLKLAELQGGF